MLESFIAGKGVSCQQKPRQLHELKQRAAQPSLMDVAIDVVQVLGHLGEDARLAGQSAAAMAPIAHDAHLHEATASMTQQRTTVVPLKHKTSMHTRSLSESVRSTTECVCIPHFSNLQKQISPES